MTVTRMARARVNYLKQDCDETHQARYVHMTRLDQARIRCLSHDYWEAGLSSSQDRRQARRQHLADANVQQLSTRRLRNHI